MGLVLVVDRSVPSRSRRPDACHGGGEPLVISHGPCEGELAGVGIDTPEETYHWL